MSATRISQNGMIICITEKNSRCSLRYPMTPCQFSKLYFHYFLFIPLIRMVGKLMRDIPAIQICREATFFSTLLITILLKDGVRNWGIRERERDTERGCVSGRGMQGEKLWGELRGPLAAALRVIDKSEEVM